MRFLSPQLSFTRLLDPAEPPVAATIEEIGALVVSRESLAVHELIDERDVFVDCVRRVRFYSTAKIFVIDDFSYEVTRSANAAVASSSQFRVLFSGELGVAGSWSSAAPTTGPCAEGAAVWLGRRRRSAAAAANVMIRGMPVDIIVNYHTTILLMQKM